MSGEGNRIYKSFEEDLKTRLHADERIKKIFAANEHIQQEILDEISGSNCCWDYLCFPVCIVSSVFLTPWGSNYCCFDHGKKHITLEMNRNCAALTDRGIYILQEALTKSQSTAIRLWGIFPQVKKDLMYGGVTFIPWNNLKYKKYETNGICSRESQHIVLIWAKGKVDSHFPIFCSNSEQTIARFSDYQKKQNSSE